MENIANLIAGVTVLNILIIITLLLILLSLGEIKSEIANARIENQETLVKIDKTLKAILKDAKVRTKQNEKR